MGGEGLLRAVIAAPEDEALRLIHADWFEDHDDPERAEFIRLQCRLAGVFNDLPLYAQGLDPWARERRLPLWERHLRLAGPTPAARDELLREATLLRRHRRRWNGAIHRCLLGTPLAGAVRSRGGGLRGWAYRRGFVEALACTPEVWRDHAALLRELGPIRCLRLHVDGGKFLAFWGDLDLGRLDIVSLEGGPISGRTFQALLTAGGVQSLPVLDLRGCQISFEPAVNAWLQPRPPEQTPRVLYRLPRFLRATGPSGPIRFPYYPPPFLPTTPQEIWLTAWLNACREG